MNRSSLADRRAEPAAAVLPSSRFEFALLSAASLFFEILFIRYLSSEIRVFAYFSNLVLLACFLGLGIGYGVARPRVGVESAAILTALLALVCQEWFSKVIPFRDISRYLSFTDLNTWTAVHGGFGGFLFGLGMLVFVLALAVLVFVPFGQALGRVFGEARPDERLYLYSINVVASVAGIWLFQTLAFLWLPPSVWLTCGGVLLLPVVFRERARLAATLAALCAGFWLTFDPATAGRVFWSPYQKLTLLPVHATTIGDHGEEEQLPFLKLDVNSTIYQYILDLSPDFVASRPLTFPPQMVPYLFYNLPYRFQERPRAVLVVGAGTGNDVAAALRNGAESVDAVEIDPAILAIGRALHPEEPYSSPRVHTVEDDARSFFKRTTRRYDVIVFGLLDSHRLTSNFSNTNLDSYVYTLESFREARRLLAPDGVLVVAFQVARPFLAERLRTTLARAFGEEPLVFSMPGEYVVRGTGGTFFVSGRREGLLARAQAMPVLRGAALAAASAPSAVEPATDDWPYLYVQSRAIPRLWLVVSAVVLALAILALRASGLELRSLDPHFFFLGTAFMLLETITISKFSLLYGATWTVSAIVISAVLLMVLAGNALAMKRSVRVSGSVYAALGGSAALSALITIDLAARLGRAGDLLLIGLSVLPLLFAALVFARSLERTADVRGAFLSNLLGAMVGGLLQSLSFVTGQRALAIIVVAAYALAYGAGRRGLSGLAR